MSKYSDGTVKIGVESLYSVQSITRRDILSLIQGPGSPKKYILSKNRTVLGRSPEADLQLKSNMVSRKHLSLYRSEGEMMCKDLNSHNGLFLNGVKVYSASLRDGDTIQIGDLIFIYHQGVQWTSL